MGAGAARPVARAAAGVAGALVASVALGYACALAWVAGVGAEAAPPRADAAVVLGAAVWEGGRASPVLARRARAAGRLWREGRVQWIATTGGVGRFAPSEGEVARALLVREGIDPARVVAETRSRTTFENLVGVRPALRARGVRSVLVVSDGYHLARGVRMARDLGFAAWGVAAEGPARVWLARDPRRVWGEAWLLVGYSVGRTGVE